jgi:tetratricopeptide (TPR) repeat protein
MHDYCMRDVERVLRLSRGTVRSLISRGFLAPRRGQRREYRFSFQDLIVLRTARALSLASVPPRRITRALANLRRALPQDVPLSGLSIRAVGTDVIVHEGVNRWQAGSGQYLLDFDIRVANGALTLIERPVTAQPAPTVQAEDWFEKALWAEDSDAATALSHYEQCLAIDPCHIEARINCGRLLHLQGQLPQAERCYRAEPMPPNATLFFNLAVLLEDLSRPCDAVEMYLTALGLNQEYADAHYNLARLYELTGERQRALRHLACYRRLISPEPAQIR